MQFLVNDSTTTLSYWLNWRVLLCAIWVIAPMFVASFMIWKNKLAERSCDLRDDDAWRPCLKEIHPIWLLAFRIIAFCLLLAAIISDVVAHGGELFLYYTQWTFTLVTIYFGYGSLLSIYGCFNHHKTTRNGQVGMDEEQGLYAHLTSRGNGKVDKSIVDAYYQQKTSDTQSASFWTHLFQILFQTTAGAVMLTDFVYWAVCFPFITIKDYDLNFLTVVAHSLNAILLLGDTALNSLKFPWFRISYFIIWTGAYVVFQWTVHACVSIWWPYPFLDLSSAYAPLWYLLVGFLHFPCYWIFSLFVRLRQYLISRWSSESYQPLR